MTGTPTDKKHERVTTTPTDDGDLLADCACGGAYRVYQGADEYERLEEARLWHIWLVGDGPE